MNIFVWRKPEQPTHISNANNFNKFSQSFYSTDTRAEMKGEIEDMLLPDLLQSELTNMAQPVEKAREIENRSDTWIMGIFTTMFNAISKRLGRAPTEPYYGVVDKETFGFWPTARTENKNIGAQDTSYTTPLNMNGDYKSSVAACEDKLNSIRHLLSSKSVPISQKTSTYRSRRPKKVFVESSSVEDNFEDAFTPEDFISHPNCEFLSYIVPQFQELEYFEVDAPKMRVQTSQVSEHPSIVKASPEVVSSTDDNIDISKTIMNTDILKSNLITQPQKTDIAVNIDSVDLDKLDKKEMVISCEEKMLKLKTMLQERCKNTKATLNLSDSNIESVTERPIETKRPNKMVPTHKSKDKHYKNPHRLSKDKRKKCSLRRLIQEDMTADQVYSEASSFEDSPIFTEIDPSNKASNIDNTSITTQIDQSNKAPIISNTPVITHIYRSVENLASSINQDYFDEVAGCFLPNSGAESDDSFQVVFTDSPQVNRSWRPSDCESEDSYIVFEESPDSCYTSNDVFGDGSDDSEGEYSDTDSEVSDSGCGLDDVSHSISRSVGDLTDDSLYVERLDEVDCAVRICEEIPNSEIAEVSDSEPEASTGVLLNDAKKLLRKNQPAKKVHFSDKPPKVHVMRVWAFAARLARPGHWERYAIDRERFKRRIADADMALSWVLKPQHRSRVMFQRFMPWWNKQKRIELAEKKQREEEEKRRKADEEKRKIEEVSLRKEPDVTTEGDVNINIEGNTELTNDSELDLKNKSNNDFSKDMKSNPKEKLNNELININSDPKNKLNDNLIKPIHIDHKKVSTNDSGEEITNNSKNVNVKSNLNVNTTMVTLMNNDKSLINSKDCNANRKVILELDTVNNIENLKTHNNAEDLRFKQIVPVNSKLVGSKNVCEKLAIT